MWLKLKPNYYQYLTKTKTAAREDFGNLKFGPQAQTACRPLLYRLATVSELSFRYTECCFPIVVETQNFSHLYFNLVSKILATSELNIHSEVEVVNAEITWFKHNIEERSNYGRQLLLKVRFTLLSEHALEYISNFSQYLVKTWSVLNY